MAESYRGLTIRIGGDTSKLTKALRTTNGAISQTQQEMRKLSQALRLDPTSVEAYDMKLGYMGDHATNVAAKLSALKRTQEQLANTSISLDGSGYVGTVEKLANSTDELGSGFDNVSGMMAVAQSRLAALTPTLGAMDNEVSDLTKSMASLQQQKIAEAFNLAAGKKSVDEIAQKFANDLPAGMVRSDEAAKQLMSDIRSMSMALVFDEGKFDVSGLRTVIEKQLSGLKGVTIDSSELDKLIAKVTNFGEEYASAYAKVMQKRDEAKARQKEAVADIAQQIRDEQNALNEAIEALRDASAPTIEADMRAVEAAEAKSAAIRAQKAEEIAAEKELRKESLANIESTIEGLRKAQSYEAQLKAEIDATRKGYQAINDDLNERVKKNDELLSQAKKERSELGKEYRSLFTKNDTDSVRRREEISAQLDALDDYRHRLESRGHELLLQSTTNAELELLQVANLEKEMAKNRLAYADDEIAAIAAVEDATLRQYHLTERLQKESHKLNMHYEHDASDDVSAAKQKRDQQEIDAANKAYADAQTHRRSETAKTTAQERRLWSESVEYAKARLEAVESAERSIREQIEQTTSKGDETAARLKSQYDVLHEAGNEEAGTLPEEQRVEVLKRCEKAAQEVMNERVANTKKRNKEIKSLVEELERVHSASNGKGVDSEIDYTKRIEEETRKREQVIKASTARVTAIQAEARTANEDEVISASVKLRQDRDSVRVQENKLVEESLERQNELAEKFDATLDESSVHSREIASITDEARKLTEETIKGLSEFGPEVKGLAGTIFSRDNGNNSFAEIEEVIDSISEQLGLSALRANNFKAEVKRLKDEFHSADNDVKQLLQVEKFQDLIVEMTKSQAAVKSLSKAMADMHVPSDLMRGMAVLNANVDELDAAYKALVGTASGLDSVLKVEPGNVDAATQAMNAYHAAEVVATEQASRMQERLRAFDPSEIEAVTDATKSSTQQLFDASLAAEKADSEYRELTGHLQFLQEELARLQSVPEESASTNSDEIREARKAYEDAQGEITLVNQEIGVTEERIKAAAEASREATKALDGAKMRKEYEEASAGATTYAANARRAAEAARDAFVRKSLTETFGDTSAIDKLGAQLSSLMSSAEAFGNAMSLDPDNIELASARMDRLSAAEQVAADRMAEIRSAMSKVDTSKVDELRQRYGSVSEAVEHLRELTSNMADIPSYLSGIKEKLFDPNASFKDYELERLPESIRKAREEVLELASQGRTAFGVLADAEKAIRYEELSEQLAAARSEFEKIAKMNVGDAISASLRGAFGDTSTIAKKLEEAMRSATGRIGSFDGALEFDSKSIELADSRMRALLDALASGKREADTLRAAMSGIDSSAVEEMRATYGSVDESVRKTGKDVDDLVRKLADAKAAQKSAVGTDEYEAAAERVNKLSSELDEAEKAAAKAAQYERWQAYEDRLAQVNAALKKLRKSSEDVAAANVEALSSNYGSGMFTEVTERVTVFDDAISKAEARYKQYVEAVKDDPSNKMFREEKAKAFAEAVDLAAQKSNYLKEVIGQFDQSKIESLKSQFGSLSKAVSEGKTELKATEKEIEDLKRKVEDFAAANGKSAEWVRQFVDAKSKIDDIPPSLAPVRQRLEELWKTQDAQQMQVAIASVCEKLEEMGVDAETAAARINQAFENAGKGRFDDAAFQQVLGRVSQLAEQAGRKMVESANTIDSAYRDMRKTVEGTEEDFESIRAEALQFSQTHFTSADTMMQMEALGGQLGVTTERLADGRTALQAFGETAANLDIATNIPAEEIALKMGQLTAVMSDLDFSTFDQFADSLVRLGNNMPTTESAIMDVAQRMSSVANVTNMTTPELLAWSAAVASAGLHAESAATSITKTVTGIGDAVSAGGVTLKSFASIAGMTADDFKTAWENGSSDALKAFISGLSTLTDDSTDAIAALDAVGISSVRQETALLALTQTIGNLGNAMTMSENAFNGVSDQWGQAGDAAREAQNKSEGFSGSLAILQNNATNLAASLGDGLIPFMDALSAVLRAATDIINAMPGPVKVAAVAIGGLAAAVGIVIPALSTLAKGWAELTGGVNPLSAAIANLRNAFAQVVPSAGVAKTSVDATKASVDALAASATNAGTAMGGLSSGLGVVGGSAGAVTGELASAGAAMATVGAETATAEAGATSLGAAFGGPVTLGIMAATAALGLIVAGVQDYVEHQRELEQATDGLRSAIDNADSAVRNYKGDIDAVVPSLQEMRDRTRELTKEQSEFAKALEDSLTEQNLDHANLDAYVDEIAKLTEKGSLTAGEMASLNDAIDRVNQTIGTSIPKLSEQNGELGMSADAIREVAKAYEQQDRVSTISDKRAEAQRHLIELEQELERQTEEGTGAIKSETDAMNAYTATLANAPTTTASLASSQEELRRDIEATKASISEMDDEIAKGEYTFSSLENALAAAGVSAEQWAGLSEEQAEKVRSAFHGKLSDIASLLSSFGLTVNRYAQQYVDALGSVGSSVSPSVPDAKPSTEQVNARRRQYDAEYKDRKRELDRAYKDQQKAYDAEYKARQKQYDKDYKAAQKQYDAVYKEQQKAYDKEYKAVQKQLDKEYKARQKAYDAEYKALQKRLAADEDALKDANDDRLDALKKANDAEEAALKKALDARYNAYKKQLDAEYDAYKKANDKVVKAYKKSQDKITKEFKKATDARIKEMQREYEAQAKLLEQNDGRAEIDKRIEQLKAETKAEEDAIEARNRADKIAELQKAVDQAKSRRKREEAEKALNDYLEELRVKDNKAAREAQIEQLEERKDAIKEETDARKGALKEQFDAEKEAYQELRDEELDALNERLDEQYEAFKESYDRQNEAFKEANDAKLAAFREQLDAELQALKDANDAEEDALKESLDGQLQTMKDAHAEQLDALKESQSEQLEAYKESQSEYLEGYKESQQAALEAMKEGQQAELEALKEGQQADLEAMKEGQQERLDKLKEDHQTELEDLKTRQAEKLEAYKNGNEKIEQEADRSGNNLVDKSKWVTNEVLAKMKSHVALMKLELDNMRDNVGIQSDDMNRAFLTPFQRTLPQVDTAVNATHNYANDKLQSMKETMERESREGNDQMARNFEGGRDSASRSVEDLHDVVRRQLEPLPSEMGDVASEGVDMFASNVGRGVPPTDSAARDVADAAKGPLDDVKEWAGNSGWNAGASFAERLAATRPHAEDAAGGIAAAVAALLHHSTPDKGPLHGDDMWGAELVDNFAKGMLSREHMVAGSAETIASAIAEGIDTTDLMGSLLQSMRDNESALAEQAARMSRIVEDGFDPRLTVDAAFEAIERIGGSWSSGASDVKVGAYGASAGNYEQTINVNLNFGDVTVRDEADLSTLARMVGEEIARQTARSNAARIGR